MKLDEFKTISNLVLTQLDKLATKTDKPEIIKLTFDLIFDETPSFEEINSHTIKMFPIFNLQAKKILSKLKILRFSFMVEHNGVEPLTSCVQGRRSSQLS